MPAQTDSLLIVGAVVHEDDFDGAVREEGRDAFDQGRDASADRCKPG